MAENLAQCIESYIAKDAIASSAFLMVLADEVLKELKIRSQIYIDHSKNSSSENFKQFFNDQKKNLLLDLENRFNKKIPLGERCDLLLEEYEIIISSDGPLDPKPPIGF